MAYETGSALDLEDLIDVKLKAFAIANGWTVNEDNWPDLLAISKGTCYANMRFDSSVTTSITMETTNMRGTQNVTDAFGVSRSDVRLWAHLSSGYTGGGAGWAGQPDSPVDSTSISEYFVAVNDLAGPMPAYHFFSGDETAGDPPYIYVVIETRTGYYSHFHFGELDSTGLGYTPNGAFMTGSLYGWWPNTTTISTRDDLDWSEQQHVQPFSIFGIGSRRFHVYGGGALPGDVMRPYTNLSRTAWGVVEVTDRAPLPGFPAGEWVSNSTEGYGKLHGMNMTRGPLSAGGVTPLHPIPILVEAAADDDILHYLGEAANIRMCSLFGLSAGQTISFGQDNWMVFPFRRQQNTGVKASDVPASPELYNTSFQYGLAIKLVE